jgi:hypothetical protein
MQKTCSGNAFFVIVFFLKFFLKLIKLMNVNVLNLHRIDLARKYYTHLQREIEKEEAR